MLIEHVRAEKRDVLEPAPTPLSDKKYLRIDRCQFVVKVRTIYLLFWWRTEELNPNSLDFCSTLLSTIRFSLELTGPKTPLDEYLSTFL